MGKAAVTLIAGRFAQALITVAAMRLLTSLLSPSQVGSVYLMLSFAAFFGLFLISPVGNYINRKLHGWHQRGQLLSRFKLFNIYVVGVSILSLPLILLGKSVMGFGADIPLVHFMVAVAFYVYAVTWNQTAVPTLNMLGHRGAFVGLSVLSAALGLLFSAGLSFFVARTAFYWLCGQAFALFLGYLLAMRELRSEISEVTDYKRASSVMSGENLMAIRSFAVPLSVSALFMWMQTQSYRVIVERFAGPEFLGYLVVGLGISASLGGVTESLVQQLYFPGFYRSLNGSSKEGRRSALSGLVNKTIPAYIVLAAFSFCMARQLTQLLAAPAFQYAWKFVLVGAVIELFRMSTNIFAAAAHAEMKTAALVKPYVLGGGMTAAAVLTACLLGAPAHVIPVVLAAGGLGAALIMWYCMGKVSCLEIDGATVLKSLLLSLGFLPALFMTRSDSIFGAIGITTVFGLYFVFVQWRLMTPNKGATEHREVPGCSREMESEIFKGEA